MPSCWSQRAALGSASVLTVGFAANGLLGPDQPYANSVQLADATSVISAGVVTVSTHDGTRFALLNSLENGWDHEGAPRPL